MRFQVATVGFVVMLAQGFAPRLDAAVPVVESRGTGGVTETAAADSNSGQLADLFYQLQLLRQEVQELRGLVEEQDYKINRLTKDTQAQYRDVDRRLAEGLRSPGGASPSRVGSTGESAGTGSIAEGVPTANPDVAVVNASGGTGATASPNEQSAYSTALELMKKQNFDESRVAFDRVISDYPNGKFTPNAFYWLGELHLAKSENERARQSFAQVVNLYPEHQKAADALYKLGVTYHRLGDDTRARDYLARVQSQFPGTSSAARARKYAEDLQ